MPAPADILTLLFPDAGTIPNNGTLPLVVYKRAVDPAAFPGDLAGHFEAMFPHGGWQAAWRWGVYDFPHFHSTAHEVLGCYRGFAEIQFGHTTGRALRVEAGDVAIIPAGVGHQNLGASPDFHVVGGYPRGQEADLLRGRMGERPQADRNIAAVPLPDGDPLLGPDGPLCQHWKLAARR